MRHVRSGAAGVILKTVDPQLFVKCARRVTEGETWIPKRQVSTMAKLLEARPATPPRPVDTLTRREKTIISYLMQGWRNREISTHLSISEQTVKNHLRTIYDKVGVSDRLELVLYAIHQRMELPPVQATVARHVEDPARMTLPGLSGRRVSTSCPLVGCIRTVISFPGDSLRQIDQTVARPCVVARAWAARCDMRLTTPSDITPRTSISVSAVRGMKIRRLFE